MNIASRFLLPTLLLATITLPLAAQTDSRTVARADSLFRESRWSEAATEYEAIAYADPKSVRAWYRLGVSLHSLGRFDNAILAFTRAASFGPHPNAMYNLACAYARNGNKDSAIAWLGRVAKVGLFDAAQIGSDEDFTSIRQDARFAAVLVEADRNAHPCSSSPEYRQLDFWVGEWEVRTGGQLAGTSSIQRILDQCVVLENWNGAGMKGKSFNFYNAATGRWQQTWVDDNGSVLELSGVYSDGAMRLTGTTRDSSGTKEHRLTFFNLPTDSVRQLWEQSTDGRKTWSVVFDGMYTRRAE